MTERKWSSGPWVVATEIADGGGQFISVTSEGWNYVINEHGISDEDDAHLIAAAPEMYEALEAVLNYAGDECAIDDPEYSKNLDKAIAALAKARGEAQ